MSELAELGSSRGCCQVCGMAATTQNAKQVLSRCAAQSRYLQLRQNHVGPQALQRANVYLVHACCIGQLGLHRIEALERRLDEAAHAGCLQRLADVRLGALTSRVLVCTQSGTSAVYDSAEMGSRI